MNTLPRHILLWLMVFIAFTAFKCNNGGDTPEPSEPIYSYREPIVNPPDVFKISFDISQNGNKTATVTFKENAVWRIDNQGDSKAAFWIRNPEGMQQGIQKSVTLGLRGGVAYQFIASNNNYDDLRDFFCKLTKQPNDYDEFEPKF